MKEIKQKFFRSFNDYLFDRFKTNLLLRIDEGYFEISIFFGDSDWSVFNNLEFTIGLEKRIGLYLII